MKVLLVVDVQNDFCPGGNLAVGEGDTIVPIVNELMGSRNFDVIVASKDWHPAGHVSFAANHPGKKVFDEIKANGIKQILWPSHCVQGTLGAEFHPCLEASRIDYVIQKGKRTDLDSYSAFFDNAHLGETELKATLNWEHQKFGKRGESITVYVCGLALDYCVAATARDARMLGYETKIILDATRPVNADIKAVSDLLRDLKDLGIEVVESREILAQNRDVSREPDRGQQLQA
ncbi:MAG: bifunctional nicotinamidase/pyrazinamidase [Bdellovibrionales bacterium]|nr:bifunctional nicotinamidase/pyrazinamidase [Bdellovibrionales bacterium]